MVWLTNTLHLLNQLSPSGSALIALALILGMLVAVFLIALVVKT